MTLIQQLRQMPRPRRFRRHCYLHVQEVTLISAVYHLRVRSSHLMAHMYEVFLEVMDGVSQENYRLNKTFAFYMNLSLIK